MDGPVVFLARRDALWFSSTYSGAPLLTENEVVVGGVGRTGRSARTVGPPPTVGPGVRRARTTARRRMRPGVGCRTPTVRGPRWAGSSLRVLRPALYCHRGQDNQQYKRRSQRSACQSHVRSYRAGFSFRRLFPASGCLDCSLPGERLRSKASSSVRSP